MTYQSVPSLKNSLFWGVARIVVSSRRDRGDVVRVLDRPEIGAAFLLVVGSSARQRTYLVTAKHVIESAEDGSIIFSAKKDANTYQPFEFRCENRFDGLWHSNLDSKIDTAILPFVEDCELAKAIKARSAKPVLMAMSSFELHANISSRPIDDFEEILFVGYPEGFWDPTTGFPIVRRGVTATPTSVPYQGQPVFLIDGAVHPGCSGSPVVAIDRELLIPPNYADPNASVMSRIREVERFHLLGMVIETCHRRAEDSQNLNLGVVLHVGQIYLHIDLYEQLTAKTRD